MKERSVRIDAMRGIAMVCVVLGHAIQRNLSVHEPFFCFLASFEMSLFAFVSGYLTSPPAQRRFSWIAIRAQRLLIPFFVWAPIMWFMSRFSFTGLDVIGIPSSLLEYISTLLARPYDGLWYLLVLFYWCLFVVLASPFLCRDQWIQVVIGACVVGSLWLLVSQVGVPSMYYGRSYFLSLLPYFAAGLAFRYLKLNFAEPVSPVFTGVSLIMFSIGYGLVIFPSMGSQVFNSEMLSILKGVLGVAASIYFILSIQEVRWLSPLASVGRASLGVYAIHLLFLRSGFGHGWTKVSVSFIFALGLSLFITWLAKHNQVTARLLLGRFPVNSN
ncbi:MAG: acyltransferase family protein [Desulfobulbaceae bacterium]|nr:acyltransferase family protein [Desulfobulbaceae bacterium]